MQHLWDSALATLRSRLSEENFRTWLEPVQLERVEGHTIVLRIPNRFYAEWISSHYLDLILESLAEPVIQKSSTSACLGASLTPDSTTNVWEVVATFNEVHRVTFTYLIHFLRDVVAHARTNGMDIEWASELPTRFTLMFKVFVFCV